jgi:K+/H+ antiporter YhaU regulatory subunit KhtT
LLSRALARSLARSLTPLAPQPHPLRHLRRHPRLRRRLCRRLPPRQEVSRDADSGGGSGGGGGGARGFVSQLQHDSDARARDAAAQLDASRAALDDERARARRSHDALHAQLREAVDARDATAERLRGALAERAALAARLSAAEAEAASAQPAAALRDAHAALLDKLAALKGGGDWDFERARLDADALQLENARLRDELAAVVAFRAKQAERDAAVAGGGAGGAGDTRALASLRAQVTELRRLQYESERERSALKAQAAALEEELARTQAYMQGNMPRYEREIVGLRKQLETLAASAPPGSAGSRAPAPPSHSADESRDASEQNATRGSEATSLSSPASGGRRTPAARPDDGLNGGVR